MPKFDVTVTVDIQRTYTTSVRAKNAGAAEARVQAIVDKAEGDVSKFPWDCDDDSFDITLEVEEVEGQ